MPRIPKRPDYGNATPGDLVRALMPPLAPCSAEARRAGERAAGAAPRAGEAGLDPTSVQLVPMLESVYRNTEFAGKEAEHATGYVVGK